MIAKRTASHLEGSVSAVAMMFISLTSLLVGLTAYDHAYERFSPADWWFTYHDVQPLHASIARDEFMTFSSIAVVHRDTHFTWLDTVYCSISGGYVLKLKTQVWRDDSLAGTKYTAEETWKYTADAFPDGATECYLSGVVTGRTPLGYQKVHKFETPPWRIEN